MTAEDWEMLANSPNPDDRLKAAKSLRCPPDLLTKLTRDAEWDVKRAAWQNKKLPVSFMRRAIQRNDMPYYLTLNKGLPSDLCLLLYTARNQYHVLYHPNFPLEPMHDIATGRNGYAKICLARNPNLTQELQTILFRTGIEIQKALAKNRHITQETVEMLSRSTSPPVLRRIITHPLAAPYRDRILRTLSGENVKQGVHTTAAIARYTTDKEYVKEVLADRRYASSPVVVDKAFRNENLDSEIVDAACYSPDSKVRKLAAKHPAASEEAQIAATLIGI